MWKCPQHTCNPQVHWWKNTASRGRNLPTYCYSLGGGCLHRPQLSHRWKSFPFDSMVLQPRDKMPALSAPSCSPPPSTCPLPCFRMGDLSRGPCSDPQGPAPLSLRATLAGENSSALTVLVTWVPLSLEGGGGDAESRGARTGGHNSSRVRRGWQHLRPQPRRKRGKTRRRRERLARRGCSRIASAAWAAASGAGSPPSRAPSGPAGSDLPPSGTTQGATGASQNSPGFLERNPGGLD